ncbi:MAG: hypothetical protein P1U49_00315 [Minwuia sp.]|nr:hypothetical protein [Minwuia sp.]
MIDFDPDLDFAGEDLPPTLRAVGMFAQTLTQVRWFHRVGELLSAEEADAAHAYLSALGFPEAGPAEIGDWMEAEEAAGNSDWNSTGWEAEEQLRAALSVQAVDIIGDEQAVLVALTHVTSTASEAVHAAAAQAASRFGIDDEGLIRAAAGSATQAAYLAALVLAAGEDEEHAFAHKFRLFESGRWPLGVTGATLNIF